MTNEIQIILAIKEMGVFRTNFPNEEVAKVVSKAIKALEQEPKILNTLDFVIDASNGDTNYFAGFRNGLRYSKSLINGEEPQFERCAEQEPILDKIRAEIIDTGAYEQEVNGKTEFLKGINYCLGVIDKYKAESEDKK